MRKLVCITCAICIHTIYCLAAVITHDISTDSLIILGGSTDDYIITGSTDSNYVVVGFGYKGTITLKDCSFNFQTVTTKTIHSPIRITGMDNLSNTDPSRTNVNIVLDGDNTIYVNGKGRAGIQVDQGAQINISAIEPCDNSSGTLTVTQANANGGAGIGSLNRSMNNNETTSSSALSNGGTGLTAGGNVVISSGTITTQGGHGAGIGGGFISYYDGMIVIYGGIVNATSNFDAAGIGSGCPRGTGLVEEHTNNSAVVVLPPAIVSAMGAGATATGGVGSTLFPELGLAGTKVRIYIGDPDKPAINVQTIDHQPDAGIYADLSQDPDINRVVNLTVDPALLDINQVYFGQTDSEGVYSTTGQLQNNTTFFSNATSKTAKTIGRPYMPTETALPNGGDVKLDLFKANFRIINYPSEDLEVNYDNQDAKQNATCIKIVYNDAKPLTDLTFDLANGELSDFDLPIFLASDSTTAISAPQSLHKGDVYYVLLPIKPNMPSKEYSDVLRIIGNWDGISTGYIRQIVNQIVANSHTEIICEGSTYNFFDTILTTTGTYYSIQTNTSSCKTESEVEVLHLIVQPTYDLTEDLALCVTDLPYRWRDTTFQRGTESGEYHFYRQSEWGCDSLTTLNLTIYDSTLVNIYDSVYIDSVYDKHNFHVTPFATPQILECTQHHSNKLGCDSTVVLHLIVQEPPFWAQVNAIPRICADDAAFDIDINYSKLRYYPQEIKVLFDEPTLSPFADAHVESTQDYVTIQVPFGIKPDIYNARLLLSRTDFNQYVDFQFMIRYPNSVMEQMWNNVIALHDESLNGGYKFDAYKWYLDDNEILSARKSYLYLGENNRLEMGHEYSAAIRRAGEDYFVMTCPITAEIHEDSQMYPTLISKGKSFRVKPTLGSSDSYATIYNANGIKVKGYAIQDGQITAPEQQGVYIVVIKSELGVESYKIIVE